ncbi:hypothetical protein H0H92_014094, partial [Tricholoma furcatifolium]
PLHFHLHPTNLHANQILPDLHHCADGAPPQAAHSKLTDLPGSILRRISEERQLVTEFVGSRSYDSAFDQRMNRTACPFKLWGDDLKTSATFVYDPVPEEDTNNDR